MVGNEVNAYMINTKAADAVLSLRGAFAKVETMAKWLANNPVVDGVDPLCSQFNFSIDEAYLIRFTFEQFDALRTANVSLFETARKLTGLE